MQGVKGRDDEGRRGAGGRGDGSGEEGLGSLRAHPPVCSSMSPLYD